MTDETNSAETPDKAAADADSAAPDSTIPGSPANKAFWMGVGIGSAGLVAALMYAKRPRAKRRT